MASLIGHWLTPHAHLFRIRALSIIVALVAADCAINGYANAAPITLLFDAVVGPPRQDFDGLLPPAWSLSLREGDRISGTFTFEPFNAASNTSKTKLVQPFEFAIHIGSRSLTTSQFGVEVFNDSVSEDVPAPMDHILVGCSAGVNTPACIPATVPMTEPLNWSFLLALSGNASILDGADIPNDPVVWQQLIFEHSMALTFIDNLEFRSYGFTATPLNFHLVPEPAQSIPILFACIYVLTIVRMSFRHPH